MPSTRPHATTAGPATERKRSVWTADQVRALGLTTDLATAADILGISRSAAYKLARRNSFPCRSSAPAPTTGCRRGWSLCDG